MSRKTQCACRKIQSMLNIFLKNGLGVVRAETWVSAPQQLLGEVTVIIMGTKCLKDLLELLEVSCTQCCQINGADSYRHLHLLQLGWSRCTQPLSCLTAGKDTENGDEQPCIWQLGVRGCVSNAQQIEDVSSHSSFSLLLAYSLPLRHTIKQEKQQRCRLSAARLSC